jgi:hypothetical protein
MNKEMTPKKSLQIIEDNITPRTLGILTVEFNVVEKAIDRLEQLETADRNNQKVVEDARKLINKNLELQKENQELRDKLNSQDLDIWKLHCKYVEYKKVIEIIKNKLKLSLSEYKTIKIINAVLPIGNNEMNRLTQQEYDLLKEVLENV